MKQWLAEWKASPVKKAFPVLSFPAVQLMGISVKELIADASAQARGMKLVAQRTDRAATVSLMDLSVEAECFGAEIRVSEDEVPTVVGSVVSTEEEAEPLAGILSPALEEEFSEPYVRELVEAVQDDSFAVIYHNCGGGVPMMADSIASTGAAVFHFGNAVDMEEMLEKMPKDRLVMGNIDPVGQFRNGTPESIRQETLALMKRCCKYDNFVISSGCDIPPMSKWENIDAFFDAAAEFYGAGRKA